jgi:hypothetical protein
MPTGPPPYVPPVPSLTVPALLRAADRALVALEGAGTDERTYALAWRAVDDLAEQLAAVAAVHGCPRPFATLLLDCRDRLGSHLLAADQLCEIGQPIDSRVRVLERGVSSMVGDLLTAAAPGDDVAAPALRLG